MNIFSWLGQKIGLRNSSAFWGQWYGGKTWAGQPSTPETAMQLSAVWRAIRLYAGTIATLPLGLYERGAGGDMEPVEGNELDTILRVQPNTYQTPVEFWEAIIGCMFLVGNGYARKMYRGSGSQRTLIGLELLNPTRTAPTRQNGRLQYLHNDDDGRQEFLEADDVFHLKGFTLGGDSGMSAIRYGAQTISSSRAADKVSGQFYRDGMLQSGFLETGKVLNKEDRERLQSIMDQYLGSDSRGLMILEGGMKYSPVEMNPEDAQLLVTRKFNIEEIARWFGVPSVLLFHNQEGQTMWGSGVEGIIRAWYQLGLRETIVRIQSAISLRLMTPADRSRYIARYNVDALLQGDSQAQALLYSSMVQNGIRTRNEVRRLVNLPRIDGADELTAQVNLVPVNQLGDNGSNSDPVEQLRSMLRIDDLERRIHERDHS